MPEYPGPHFPVIYADGVSSASNSGQTVKFYLARFDPDMLAESEAKQHIFAQVVLPISGFVGTAVFFERYLEKLLQQGSVTQEQVDAVRNAL